MKLCEFLTENDPRLLNLCVCFFCFRWQSKCTRSACDQTLSTKLCPFRFRRHATRWFRRCSANSAWDTRTQSSSTWRWRWPSAGQVIAIKSTHFPVHLCAHITAYIIFSLASSRMSLSQFSFDTISGGREGIKAPAGPPVQFVSLLSIHYALAQHKWAETFFKNICSSWKARRRGRDKTLALIKFVAKFCSGDFVRFIDGIVLCNFTAYRLFFYLLGLWEPWERERQLSMIDNLEPLAAMWWFNMRKSMLNGESLAVGGNQSCRQAKTRYMMLGKVLEWNFRNTQKKKVRNDLLLLWL